MKKRRSRAKRRRGISRIDQPSTRTHGWFVRAGFYKRRGGTYAPRHRKFFGDVSHGGKRRALRAAEQYLAKVTKIERAAQQKKKKARTVRRQREQDLTKVAKIERARQQKKKARTVRRAA